MELSKHHFDFGHEDGAKTTTSQKIFINKLNNPSLHRHSRSFINKINIAGDGMSPPMHTTTQADFKRGQFTRDTKEENVLYSKLRHVNITYGEHVPVYESANRRYGSLRNHKIALTTTPHIASSNTPGGNFNANGEMEARLKQSYVTLGDDALANAYFSSTQKTFFQEKGAGEREAVVQNSNKTNAHHFTIGGSNNLFDSKTTSKEQFGQGSKTVKAATDFVGHLKANHFHLAHEQASPANEHFQTLHQNYFKQPGSSSGVEASKFASEKKQELMKNHFDFGGPTLLKNAQVMQSSTKAYFNSPINAQTPKAPPQQLPNNAGALKYKSVNVLNGGPTAHPGAGFFASNTSTSFKWIQPQFVN